MRAHFYEFLPPRAPLGSHSKYQKKKKKKIILMLPAVRETRI